MLTIQVDDNLTLRQVQESDAEAVFNIINNQREYLGKWLPFVEYTKKVTDTLEFIQSIYSVPEEKVEKVFIINYNKQLVGLVGFKNTDKANRKTEIGYWLSEKFQHKGIVTKAVKKLADFAFNDLYLNRIEIRCAVGNISSINIPKRVGFLFEGIEREGELLCNGFTDLERYSLLKADFQKLN